MPVSRLVCMALIQLLSWVYYSDLSRSQSVSWTAEGEQVLAIAPGAGLDEITTWYVAPGFVFRMMVLVAIENDTKTTLDETTTVKEENDPLREGTCVAVGGSMAMDLPINWTFDGEGDVKVITIPTDAEGGDTLILQFKWGDSRNTEATPADDRADGKEEWKVVQIVVRDEPLPDTATVISIGSPPPASLDVNTSLGRGVAIMEVSLSTDPDADFKGLVIEELIGDWVDGQKVAELHGDPVIFDERFLEAVLFNNGSFLVDEDNRFKDRHEISTNYLVLNPGKTSGTAWHKQIYQCTEDHWENDTGFASFKINFNYQRGGTNPDYFNRATVTKPAL